MNVMKQATPIAVRRLNRNQAKARGARQRAGFSLIEVVAATAVLAFGLCTAVITLQIGFRDLDTAKTSTVVSQALQSEAERLRMLNWTSIVALPASETVDLTTSFTSEAVMGGRLTVTRTLADVTGYDNMKEIVLRATWTAIDGKSHTRSLFMRYAKGGLYDYYYSAATS